MRMDVGHMYSILHISMERRNHLRDGLHENFLFDISNVSMTDIIEEEIDFPSFCERSDVN